MFVLTMPLYADPGGSPSIGAQSFAMISDQAPDFGAAQSTPAPAESSKSIVTQIAGGVAAILVGILLVINRGPLLRSLPLPDVGANTL